MKETLIQLSKGVQKGPAADLVSVLFGERSPTVSKKDIKFTLINSNLDHSQVSQAISSIIFFRALNSSAYIFLGSEVCFIIWSL